MLLLLSFYINSLLILIKISPVNKLQEQIWFIFCEVMYRISPPDEMGRGSGGMPSPCLFLSNIFVFSVFYQNSTVAPHLIQRVK